MRPGARRAHAAGDRGPVTRNRPDWVFAAGGFAGTPATGEPTPWGIATASNAEQTVKLWKLTPAPGAAQTFAVTQTATIPVGDPSLPLPPRARAPSGSNLTAYDRQGRSLVLGAPLRLTLQALPRPSLIFQDPPKHVDWLDGSFVNVSRTPEIKVEFTDTTNKQFSNKTTTTSDYTIGGSASDTVKVTAQEGLEGIEKAKDSVQVSAGIKYSHDENKDIYISYGSTYELAVSAATGDDDLVGGAYQTISVWRYPILGELLRRLDGSVVTDASGQPLHPFYELQLPGAVEQINPPMGGRGLDWYQPLHEKGTRSRTPTHFGRRRARADPRSRHVPAPGRHHAEEAGARQARLRAGYHHVVGRPQDRHRGRRRHEHHDDVDAVREPRRQEQHVRQRRRLHLPRGDRGERPRSQVPVRPELGQHQHLEELGGIGVGLHARAGERRQGEPGL